MAPMPSDTIDGLTMYTAATIQYEDHDSCKTAEDIAADDHIPAFCVEVSDLGDSEDN